MPLPFRYAVLAAALTAAAGLGWLWLRPSAPEAPAADIKDIVPASATTTSPDLPEFVFEIKDTPQGRQQGLSGRETVPANYGMLFVFDRKDKYGFWMKDMRVPIDIIWLSDTGAVIGVEENVSPDTYPSVFYPPQPVRFVLETKAGESREKGWSVGSVIPLPLRFE